MKIRCVTPIALSTVLRFSDARQPDCDEIQVVGAGQYATLTRIDR